VDRTFHFPVITKQFIFIRFVNHYVNNEHIQNFIFKTLIYFKRQVNYVVNFIIFSMACFIQNPIKSSFSSKGTNMKLNQSPSVIILHVGGIDI